MKELALVLWFFLVTVLVILFYQYRDWMLGFWQKIQGEQQHKQESPWQHPSLKWPLRAFLLLTAVAWLDLLIWGITSVLPLALFLAIFGGHKALQRSGHILLALAALWVTCQLLFGLHPARVIEHFDLPMLCKIYGVTPAMVQPLIIPLVVLFFLGIAAIIWRKHVFWGVGAIVLASCLPFAIGFLFGGKAEGIGAHGVTLLARFYQVTPALLKVLLLPQMVFIAIGIILIFKKRHFSGIICLVVGLIGPLAAPPLKKLHAAFVAQPDGQSSLETLAKFYGVSLAVFKAILLAQVALFFSVLLFAYRNYTGKAVFLFFVALFLPWLAMFLQQGWQNYLQPVLQNAPRNIVELASWYNRPVGMLQALIVPMLLTAMIGIALLFHRRSFGAGVVLLLLAGLLPWLYEPLQMIYGHIRQLRIDGLATFYRRSPETIHTLILPMAALLFFGLIAICRYRGFWGGLLILAGLMLPWIIEPLQHGVTAAINFNYLSLATYYQVSPAHLLLYFPAMVVFSLWGLLELTVKNRMGPGMILIGGAVYFPIWWPWLYKTLI